MKHDFRGASIGEAGRVKAAEVRQAWERSKAPRAALPKQSADAFWQATAAKARATMAKAAAELAAGKPGKQAPEAAKPANMMSVAEALAYAQQSARR